MKILNWKLFLEELVGSEYPISNYDDYVEGMQQSIEDFYALKEAVNLEVIDLLEKSGIELAAANTDVIVRQAKQ